MFSCFMQFIQQPENNKMAYRNTRSTLLSKNKSLKKCCYEDFANLETGNRLD